MARLAGVGARPARPAAPGRRRGAAPVTDEEPAPAGELEFADPFAGRHEPEEL
ncbi:hypothetical protein [Saccharothrix xinjiangensis]|uniref:Uncharacterized protein n=1 Tax=Saccharothrix xinjiangensis TaxID=204798 RepID=A0ABV9Y2J7_9PSEU